MNKKKLGMAGIVILLVCIGIAAGVLFQKQSRARIAAENLELGEQYLLEEDYEAAVVAFMKVIETDPKCAEAYLKAADAYVGLGDYDSAIEWLETGYGRTGDQRLKDRREELGYTGDTEVVWNDVILERMLRSALEIPEGTPVHVRDLDGIEEVDILGDQHIAFNSEGYTGGYRYAAESDGIWTLEAYYSLDGTLEGGVAERGGIQNIEVFRYFRGLRTISVAANHIKDVSVLNEMKNLEFAFFWANDISDLSPLERFNAPLNTEQFVEIGDILIAGDEF